MKVAVFYPWANVFERTSGASIRTGHMLDVLGEHFEEIIVVAPTDHGTGEGNVRHVSYRLSSDIMRNLKSRLRSRFVNNHTNLQESGGIANTLGRRYADLGWLIKHYKYSLNPSFIQATREAVHRADACVVEYAFHAAPAMRLCGRNKKVIITALDIVSNQIEGSGLIKKLTLRAELKALKRAHLVICVSDEERDMLRGHGINAEVIPHGVDTREYRSHPRKNDAEAKLRTILGNNFPGGRICLLVGSFHPPNSEAAWIMRKMARMVKPGGGPVNFVVVGDCCTPEQQENFFSLGKVDRTTLNLLYQAADLLVIPLMRGTGSSIKTLEAMAYGKTVLGTTVAFRGYPVKSGVHCIVSNDIDRYPELIEGILSNQRTCQTIGVNARAFAESHDYRRLYRRYIDLLQDR